MTPPRDIGELVDRLYTLPRSLTGNGVRQSLEVLQSFLPLQMTEYPSGASYFGWQIPREWNIRDAYVKNRQGERLIDFNVRNLHVVGHSVPVHKTVDREIGRAHV